MEFSHPPTILKNLSLGEGSTVVDLGSGSGHYSMAASRLVGREGRVYAVDIQKDLLERLKQAAEAEGKSNIEVVWGDIDQYGGTKLREETADLVLLCNVLFQVEDARTALSEAVRVLKNKGRLVMVDWTDSHSGLGPEASRIVTQDQARELAQHQPLEEEKTFDAGSHHWGLVWRKQA